MWVTRHERLSKNKKVMRVIYGCNNNNYDTEEYTVKIELRMRLLQYGDRLRHIELRT